MSREARRLNELKADIAKLQAHLIQKRRDLQVEIQELDFLLAQLAKIVGCAGDQGNGFPMQDLEKRELHILRTAESASAWPRRDRTLEKVARVARNSGVHHQRETAGGTS